MNRLLHAYFPLRTLCLMGLEIALILLAFVAAMVLQTGVSGATHMLAYGQGILRFFVIAMLFLACMYYFDLYDSSVLSNRRELLARMVQSIGAISLVLAALYSVIPALQFDHDISVMGLVIGGAALAGARGLFLLANNSDRFHERSLILGNGALAHILKREIQHRPELGIRIVEVGGEQSNSALQRTSTVQDDLTQLPDVVNLQRITRIILAPNDRRGTLPLESLLQLKKRGIRIDDGADLYEGLTGKVPLEVRTLSSLLFSRAFRPNKVLLLYKRVFSIIGAFLGLFLCAPLMFLVAIAIRLDSPGPVIFRQKRVGKDAKPFVLYKFRSMYIGPDHDENQRPAAEKDDRFTKIGRWIRRARIDELPQLYNILRGEMYFVGPRPFVSAQEEELAVKIPFYRQRWSVRPGATGWAQVNRGYCATIDDNAEKLAYDLFYIKNMSIGLDLFILFKTVKILLLGRGSR